MQQFIVFRNIYPNAGAQYIVKAETYVRAIQAVLAATDTVADGWIAHKLNSYNPKIQSRLIAESVSL